MKKKNTPAAIVSHGDAAKCPEVVAGRATRCPGHTLPELTPEREEQIKSFALMAARTVFAQRGNHAQVHLNQIDLAMVIAAAVQLASEEGI